MAAELPDLTVLDATAWRAWLDEHHDASDGVWLVLAKKGTTAPTSLSYGQALEEALAHGWIDGQIRSGDGRVYRQRFTPRRKRSAWSKRNVEIVKRLLAEGRMHPSGIAAMRQAQRDGRWETAYPGPATSEVPDDLATALAAEPAAGAMFAILSGQNRYAVLHRIETAKRPETRKRRIEQFVAMLSRGETIYPQRTRLSTEDTRGG